MAHSRAVWSQLVFYTAVAFAKAAWSQPLTAELDNISTRSRVLTGDNVMIGGLIIDGNAPKTVLIRARGPSMGGPPFNLRRPLPDPFLQLFSGDNVIAFNDDWREMQPAEIIGAGLSPCEPNPGQTVAPPVCNFESAVMLHLPPGDYTAIVSGHGDQTGVGLLEIFDVADVTIPDALGNYVGSSTVRLSDCDNPANNGTLDFSSSINVTSQNASLFTAGGTFSGPSIVNLDFTGTVTPGAGVMGSFTFSSLVGTGEGFFTGFLGINSITLDFFAGRVTSGEGCRFIGLSLSGVRGVGSALGTSPNLIPPF